MFGCIASQGWHKGRCFDSVTTSTGVCGYGTAIGVMAFVVMLIFLVVDALFDNMSNVQLRKYVILADILCSGESC